MTERDIFAENDLVSATECTGAAPRAMDEAAAETIGALTNARCSPSYAAEDPGQSPLKGGKRGEVPQAHGQQPDGNERPSDTHSQRTTKPAFRPAKGCGRCRRD